MVVDLKSLRRAIKLGNEWVEKTFQIDFFDYYGFQKGFSSIPLSITVPDFNLHFPAGYGLREVFVECASISWNPVALIYESKDTGEVWEGRYVFQLRHLVFPNLYSTDVDVDCKVSPDSANPKRRVLWLKVANVYEFPVPPYYSPLPFPRMVLYFVTPKHWITVTDDVRRDVGKEWTITLDEFEVPASIRYNNRITNYVAAMHYLLSSSTMDDIEVWVGTPDNPRQTRLVYPGSWLERANRIFNYLKERGYWYHYYAPLYRFSDKEGNGVADYPDSFWIDPNIMEDCDNWDKEWISPYRYAYWSKACFCTSVYLGRLAVPEWPGWIAMRAMHLMNKYSDPHHPEDFVINYATGKGFTAVDWLINGGKVLTRGGVLTVSPLIACYKPGFGVHHQRWPDAVMPVCTACALAAFAELGYGFDYNEPIRLKDGTVTNAKDIADDLAEILVKSQWGYPFTPGEEGKANTEYYGVVNRPDQTGGWSQFFFYQDGVITHTYKTDWVEELTDIFIGMPPEMMLDSWVGFEPTAHCVRALQIYEYYKFKGGKGRFPPLLIPEDIDGDGWVSELDVAYVQLAKELGMYGPLCDINLDGVVDDKDVNLVKAQLGRGKPKPGIIWTPTLSEKVQVGVF